jgi:hypothetical protein
MFINGCAIAEVLDLDPSDAKAVLWSTSDMLELLRFSTANYRCPNFIDYQRKLLDVLHQFPQLAIHIRKRFPRF